MRRAVVTTVEDAADYLGVSIHELDEEIAAGHLPVIAPTPYAVIHDSDLEAFIEARNHPTPVRQRIRKFFRTLGK